MRASDFIRELHPFVAAHGWADGRVQYDRARSEKPAEPYEMGAGFSVSQGMWKLLLPESVKGDVFIADVTLGSIPIDLSRSFTRVLVFSFQDYAGPIIAERVKEAQISNVVVLEEVTRERLLEAKYSIGLSVIVVSEDLMRRMGKTGFYGKLEALLNEIAAAAEEKWVNVVVYPKKSYCHSLLRFKNEAGLSTRRLVGLNRRVDLKTAYRYNLLGSSEMPREVQIEDERTSHGKPGQPGTLQSFRQKARNSIKKWSWMSPAELIALSRGKRPQLLLDGFISTLRKENVIPGDVSVVSYATGNPSMILLGLREKNGKRFICRMPLGKGLSLHRAKNNYKALEYLGTKENLREMVPKPVHQGEFKGQPFFLESFLEGHHRRMTHENFKEILGVIWPVLLGFYAEHGKDVVIDAEWFDVLTGEAMSTLRRGAVDGGDFEKLDLLEKLLQKNLLRMKVRLPLVHGDCKVENVLFDSRGKIGIFDWDLWAPQGFPFIDLLYLYGYSFHERQRDNGAGILQLIATQLLAGEPEPLLDGLLKRYAGDLGIGRDWMETAGCLFSLHYITKTRGSVLSIPNSKWYVYCVRKVIDGCIKKLEGKP